MSLEPGLTTQAQVVRVIDGDTLEVSVTRTFKIRLKDFLAAEHNTPDGVIHKNDLEDICKTGDTVLVFIPSNNPNKLMDINSFDRLLGIVYKNEQDIRNLMVDKGHGARYIRPNEKPHEGI